MKILQLLMLIMLAISFSSGAKMYKWVDENGKVYYSDKVPPDQVDHARERLSDNGVVKEKVKRALTDEEKIALAAEIEQKKKMELEAKLAAEKEAKEKNKILMSYSSADQIIRLKNERVNALKRNIETAKGNLAIQEKNETDLMKRAADKERNGEVVSETFLSQINQVKEQIAYQKKFITDKTAEIDSTEAKYEDELQIYYKYTKEDNAEESSDTGTEEVE